MKMGIVDNIESEWENRAKWIMDQYWFQSEASFRLDVPEELDYEKWTSMIVERIDSKVLEENKSTKLTNVTPHKAALL